MTKYQTFLKPNQISYKLLTKSLAQEQGYLGTESLIQMRLCNLKDVNANLVERLL